MSPLENPKHELFAQAVAKGASASEAYVSAGYKFNEGNAIRLKGNEKVKARIEELVSAAATKAKVSIERVVEELAKMAFSDIRKAVKWRGNVTVIGTDPDTDEPQTRAFNEVALVDSQDIDDATAGAISEVSQSEKGGVKIKFHDKKGPLELLGRYLGMFRDRLSVENPDGTPITVQIVKFSDDTKRRPAK